MAGELTRVDTAHDAWLLPEAGTACACCVRESLDAAGIALDCAVATCEDEETDPWPMP